MVRRPRRAALARVALDARQVAVAHVCGRVLLIVVEALLDEGHVVAAAAVLGPELLRLHPIEDVVTPLGDRSHGVRGLEPPADCAS